MKSACCVQDRLCGPTQGLAGSQAPLSPNCDTFSRLIEVVRDGFVTPHQLTSVPGSISGCVYRADGSKVALSERFGGFLGDHLTTENPDRIDVSTLAKPQKGRGLYLGHFMGGHYGHFITEGLSTFWVFEDHPATQFQYFVFHPFSFGVRVPPYTKMCLELFGIPEERIVFVGQDRLQCSELVIPERLFRLNHSADVRSHWTYQAIARAAPINRSMPERVYLSRRKFSHQQFDRVVANEVELEHVFRSHDFEIIYPETLNFLEQVSLCANASVVAGVSGSGLHNSLFMKPGRLLIELGDPRYDGLPAPTQTLCNHVAGVRTAFIPFAGIRFGPRGTMLFNVSSLKTALSNVLGSSASRYSRSRLKDAVEIAYLATRPALGFLARKFVRWRT